MRNSLIINGGWRYLRVCRSHNESEFKYVLASFMREPEGYCPMQVAAAAFLIVRCTER